MEWTQSLRKAIDFMESNLLADIGAEEVAESVYMSPFYFQKGFRIMTGYSVGEYIKSRRLYLAALDVIADRKKIIDLAYQYGYDTPESFTKAFCRFHGVSPMQLKKEPARIQTFLPLKIMVSIKGGNKMDFIVEQMNRFQVIGYEKTFSYETAQKEIPKFWDEFHKSCVSEAYDEETMRVIQENLVGVYGICIDDQKEKGSFHYMIAGAYHGGKVPEGMKVFELPALNWAKFFCTGPMPQALQSVNNRIFEEWLPGNPDWEMAADINVEWYSCMGDMQAENYKSAVWIPVRQR